jgi:hypothetical protein
VDELLLGRGGNGGFGHDRPTPPSPGQQRKSRSRHPQNRVTLGSVEVARRVAHNSDQVDLDEIDRRAASNWAVLRVGIPVGSRVAGGSGKLAVSWIAAIP